MDLKDDIDENLMMKILWLVVAPSGVIVNPVDGYAAISFDGVREGVQGDKINEMNPVKPDLFKVSVRSA